MVHLGIFIGFYFLPKIYKVFVKITICNYDAAVAMGGTLTASVREV